MANILSRSFCTLGGVFLVCALFAPSLAQANEGQIIFQNRSGDTRTIEYQEEDWDDVTSTSIGAGKDQTLKGTNIKLCIKNSSGKELGYIHFFKKKSSNGFLGGTSVDWELRIRDLKNDGFDIKKTKNNSESKKTVTMNTTSFPNGNKSQVKCFGDD